MGRQPGNNDVVTQIPVFAPTIHFTAGKYYLVTITRANSFVSKVTKQKRNETGIDGWQPSPRLDHNRVSTV